MSNTDSIRERWECRDGEDARDVASLLAEIDQLRLDVHKWKHRQEKMYHERNEEASRAGHLRGSQVDDIPHDDRWFDRQLAKPDVRIAFEKERADMAEAERDRMCAVVGAAQGLFEALDYADPAWRDDTVVVDAQTDEVNAAWCVLSEALKDIRGE